MSTSEKGKKENEKTEKSEEKLIDPLSLLSSDLLKEINKENSDNDDNIQLDDTQKESDENESDNNDFKIKPKQQSSSCLNNINLNSNLFNNNCFYNDQNRNNYYKNYNNNMNKNLNNFSDKLNFFNNSFSMNGKQGWICTSCKNFNYESKYSIFNYFIFMIL